MKRANNHKRPESETPPSVDVDVKSLIPSELHDRKVWLSCYRVFCVSQDTLVNTQPFKLLGVRGQMLWGAAPYWKSTVSMMPQPDGGVVVVVDAEGVRHAKGLHPSIDIRVSEFLAAVYWDLLLDTLGIETRKAAGGFLDSHESDEWFPG